MQTRIFTSAPNGSRNASAQTVKPASINERSGDGKLTSDASFEMGIANANVARHLWPFTYKGKHLPQRQLVSALMLVDFMNQVPNLQTAQLVAFAQLSDAVYCLRDLGVAARLAARNPLQRLPNFLLEGGGAHVERQVDCGLLAAKASQQRLNVTDR